MTISGLLSEPASIEESSQLGETVNGAGCKTILTQNKGDHHCTKLKQLSAEPSAQCGACGADCHRWKQSQVKLMPCRCFCPANTVHFEMCSSCGKRWVDEEEWVPSTVDPDAPKVYAKGSLKKVYHVALVGADSTRLLDRLQQLRSDIKIKLAAKSGSPVVCVLDGASSTPIAVQALTECKVSRIQDVYFVLHTSCMKDYELKNLFTPDGPPPIGWHYAVFEEDVSKLPPQVFSFLRGAMEEVA